MKIAHENRPNGPLIKRKYDSYKSIVYSSAATELANLIEKKKIAIIPIGFRCHTALSIKEKLHLSLQSFPFTSGFFSPHSVLSVLKNNTIEMNFDDGGKTHSVSTKIEGYQDKIYGRGINFQTRSYDYINSHAKSKAQKNINTLLDSTFAYYTLNKQHKFLLAHYNWHVFANESKSNGVTDPNINLKIINETLNRRISRMMKLCDEVDHIFFIFSENQRYEYIKIDDDYFSLKNFEELDKFCKDKYGYKYFRLNIDDISSPETILKLCKYM